MKKKNIGSHQLALQEVGYIALWWSHVEDIVEVCLCLALGGSIRKNRAVTTYLGMNQQLTALCVLLQAKYPKKAHLVRKDFGKLIKKMDDLRVRRNAAVHSIWIGDKGTAKDPVLVLRRYEPRKSLKNKVTKIKKSELQILGKEIVYFSAELVAHMEVMYGLDAWRYKWKKSKKRASQVPGHMPS